MNHDTALVDEIVSRVLEQLRPVARHDVRVAAVASMPPTSTPPTSAPPANTPASNAPGAPVASGVRISELVITQGLLADATSGTRQIRISSRAILTPSARDFVKARGIDVIREAVVLPASPRGIWQVLVTRSTPQVQASIDQLRAAGVACQRQLLGGTAEAAAHATSALCRGEATGTVVFSAEPELVACLANRNERVRGASVASVASIAAVRRSFSPNLLAIDPTNKGVFEINNLLKAALAESH